VPIEPGSCSPLMLFRYHSITDTVHRDNGDVIDIDSD
jgi:hypothetical protein